MHQAMTAGYRFYALPAIINTHSMLIISNKVFPTLLLKSYYSYIKFSLETKSYDILFCQTKACHFNVHPINHTRAGMERQHKAAKVF